MLYVMITSMIGGLQLFDIPNLIVNRGGTNGVASTVVMDISTRINSSQGDMGVAGAESVVLFLVAGLIGIFMFRIMQSDEDCQRMKSAVTVCLSFVERFPILF